MFSSAQIEYTQYWLYAMKLTREPIALPSSEYLIQMNDLQHVSSVIYKNGQEFKKAQKVRPKSHGKDKKKLFFPLPGRCELQRLILSGIPGH